MSETRAGRLLECLALLSLAAWTAAAVAARLGARNTPWLDSFEEAPDERCPPLRVVVAACNEEATIEPAMESLLAVDYPRLEILAVDDRSTDQTGAILDRLAEDSSRLRVIHLNQLPPGWLGKNHALWMGASAAGGEFILFTDADVLFRSDALRRAMAAAQIWQADHLVLAPGIILTGFWEKLLVSYFGLMFSLRTRAWQVNNPRSSAYIGIGAFNLVRRRVYEAVGGHSVLKLEVADNLNLGRLLRRSGGRQGYVLGGDPVKVRWIEGGIAGFVRGLTKNFFAGVEYRWSTLVGVTAVIGALHVLPAVGLFAGTRLSRALFAGSFLAMAVAATPPRSPAIPARMPVGLSPRAAALEAAWEETAAAPWTLYGLAYPAAAALWLFAMWRSAVLAELRGGIEWRGTFYSLKELRAAVLASKAQAPRT